MLRSFRLGNHRSFRDEHELSLIPAYDHDRPVVPVAAIYGANASGKSNLLDGLRFMSVAVGNSFRVWEPDSGVPRRPFLLDDEASVRPSTFVVEIVVDEVPYTYGFTVDDGQFGEEWLYSYPLAKKRLLFNRVADEITFGPSVQGTKTRFDAIEELVRPNALFLSLAAQLGIEPLLPIYRWFTTRVRFRGPRVRASESAMVNSMRRMTADDPLYYRMLSGLLTAADIGIRNVSVDEAEDEKAFVLVDHGGPSPFRLDDESDGTRTWLELLLVGLGGLKVGGTLVVDEVDASLHPLLTARLVGLFRDREINKTGAQLIFSTHDASLLGTMLGEEVLARDQVWFVEKDTDGASKLYPLTDFKPRQGENTERRYLGGSYGAVPVVDPHDFLKAMRVDDQT